MHKHFAPIAVVLLSLSVSAQALTISPTFDDSGAAAWNDTQKAVVNQAIADWQSVLNINETVNITFDFQDASGAYLGQWSGGYSSVPTGSNIRPWTTGVTHVIHFAADFADFWWDTTPGDDGSDQPFDEYDALSVARHELGHAMGFTNDLYNDDVGNTDVNLWGDRISGGFDDGVDDDVFDAAGLNVAMEDDWVHIDDPTGTGDLTDNWLMQAALVNSIRLDISQTELDMLSLAYGYDVIPEPASMVLLATGGAILLIRRRRRAA